MNVPIIQKWNIKATKRKSGQGCKKITRRNKMKNKLMKLRGKITVIMMNMITCFLMAQNYVYAGGIGSSKLFTKFSSAKIIIFLSFFSFIFLIIISTSVSFFVSINSFIFF